MPFNELPRPESWPPTIVHIPPTPTEDDTTKQDTFFDLAAANTASASIDEDPISFFLTSPTDLDLDFFNDGDDDDEDLSAGIEGSPESKSLPIREVSPSSIQRQRKALPLPGPEDEEDVDEEAIEGDSDDDFLEMGVGIPLSLKDFTRRHSDSSIVPGGRKLRLGPRAGEKEKPIDLDAALKGLGIELPDSRQARRGRAKLRLTPNRMNNLARGRARSISARRPGASWRVPSPDIWSIEEEAIEEAIMEGEMGMGLSMSAPATSQIAQLESVMAGLSQKSDEKKVKRVHWAI